MNKMALTFGIIMTVLASIMSAYIVSSYFSVTLPANLTYQREFGDDVVMAYDQADFKGISDQLAKIWTKMNQTFVDADYAHTYCDINFYPWSNNLVYSNSLKCQNDYFVRMNSSLAYNSECKYNATFRPFMWDEFKALNDTRNEMKREGGLDWALRGCWIQRFNASYFIVGNWYIYWVLLAAVLWVLAIIGFVVCAT
jgi:hypothetical protein